MNSQKIMRNIKQNYIFYCIGFLLIFGMKYFYSRAGSDELKWLLAPTTRLVTLLSGIPFVYERGAGYVNHSLRFLIAPSCCGIQFMIITIATLIFSFVHRMGATESTKKAKPFPALGRGLLWTFGSIAASYLVTILVNGMRIILAIYIPVLLENANIQNFFLTPGQLHTAIGTFVYFVSLLTIYRIAGYISLKLSPESTRDAISSCGEQNHSGKLLPPIARKCLSPVFWYLFIVLGIPFLNRAYQKGNEKFMEYTILVTSICLSVLLVFGLLGLAYRLIKGAKKINRAAP